MEIETKVKLVKVGIKAGVKIEVKVEIKVNIRTEEVQVELLVLRVTQTYSCSQGFSGERICNRLG